jgi:ketosteroid isomerase-like protein
MFGANDLEGIMEDYADDAILISGDGVLRGTDEIRGMYSDLLPEFDHESVEFELDEQIVEDEYAFIIWHAKTPENVYEFASDTFVVRDGEIVAQTLAVDAISR